MEENNAGSDSDTNSVDDAQDYYEPISAIDLDAGDDEEEDNFCPISEDGFNNGLSNGHCMIPETEERLSSISINGHVDHKSESEEEDAETETETEESEIRVAFEEDESRRRSALRVENAAQVMEAMRAISFPGNAPDWASEDRWVDQLRRLRSTTQN
ncbi:hypothetical protein AALP_AA1G068400 [Arabis alpina]|uniref:Uncharacterized protein n=1 Tax=Arabis alpina TaxID=50452 RepID=A0A087HLL7_ARAAL|nr:hypothetical protein AALP_AA1G068400 [Arabis alpina]